jgi:RimJ/RimL family protein N-acetyltransferase
MNHIGAHITNTYWNQGFAFETLTELIRYGFDVRGLQNIFGIVSTDHTVSKKLLAKLGIEFFNEMEIDGTTVHLHRKRQ